MRKVKGQGQRYPSQCSIQLTQSPFVSHRLDQPFLRYGNNNVRLGKNGFDILRQKIAKINQVESMTRGIYLSSFVAIGWAVLTLSGGQGKFGTASAA